MSQIDELVARLSRATGPDRELDALIEIASDCPCWLDGADRPALADGWEWTADDADEDGSVTIFMTLGNKTSKKHHKYSAPAYTSSIDAAMTLFDEDETRSLKMERNPAELGRKWHVSYRSMYFGHSASLPIALCIAARKSRSQP